MSESFKLKVFSYKIVRRECNHCVLCEAVAVTYRKETSANAPTAHLVELLMDTPRRTPMIVLKGGEPWKRFEIRV